jgi:hypothetical protein
VPSILNTNGKCMGSLFPLDVLLEATRRNGGRDPLDRNSAAVHLGKGEVQSQLNNSFPLTYLSLSKSSSLVLGVESVHKHPGDVQKKFAQLLRSLRMERKLRFGKAPFGIRIRRNPFYSIHSRAKLVFLGCA